MGLTLGTHHDPLPINATARIIKSIGKRLFMMGGFLLFFLHKLSNTERRAKNWIYSVEICCVCWINQFTQVCRAIARTHTLAEPCCDHKSVGISFLRFRQLLCAIKQNYLSLCLPRLSLSVHLRRRARRQKKCKNTQTDSIINNVCKWGSRKPISLLTFFFDTFKNTQFGRWFGSESTVTDTTTIRYR